MKNKKVLASVEELIEEGLVDRQYIEKYTDGYLELKNHVKDFTPEEIKDEASIKAKGLTNRLVEKCNLKIQPPPKIDT